MSEIPALELECSVTIYGHKFKNGYDSIDYIIICIKYGSCLKFVKKNFDEIEILRNAFALALIVDSYRIFIMLKFVLTK